MKQIELIKRVGPEKILKVNQLVKLMAEKLRQLHKDQDLKTRAAHMDQHSQRGSKHQTMDMVLSHFKRVQLLNHKEALLLKELMQQSTSSGPNSLAEVLEVS